MKNLPTNILVFDIETIPDIDGLKKILSNPDSTDDKLIEEYMSSKGKEPTDFMPLYLHKVVNISCLMAKNYGSDLRIGSINVANNDEKAMIQAFVNMIDKYNPLLVSWNGKGFDLPVLSFRSNIHKIPSVFLWNTGETQDFKYNNYTNRYHHLHCDVMDVMALHTGRNASLNEMAKLCGFVGKTDIDGKQVFDLYKKGDMQKIQNYCEEDVVNTYLLYLNQMRVKNLSYDKYDAALNQLDKYIMDNASEKSHLLSFLKKQ